MRKLGKEYDYMLTLRISQDDAKKLSELCRFAGVSRSAFLRGVINKEYDAINGNPKMKELLDNLSKMSDEMSAFLGDRA